MIREEGLHRLKSLLVETPPPPIDEDNLCPCYEQLVGAAYAFGEAARLGFLTRSLRDYHTQVRNRIGFTILEFDSRGTHEYQTWASGFYFNAGLQRIVWTGERLLAVLAGLPLANGEEERVWSTKRFPEVVSHANQRWNDLSSNNELRIELRSIREYLGLIQGPGINLDRDPVTEKNFLKAIREDVNKRKHAVGGFHRKSAGPPSGNAWSALRSSQYEYGIRALEVTARMYNALCKARFELSIFRS